MHLSDPSNEAAYLWLRHSTEGSPEQVSNLTWRIGTSQLFAQYQAWVRRTKFNEIAVEDFWKIIQILYPFCEIIGPRGGRVYIGVRQKYNSQDGVADL